MNFDQGLSYPSQNGDMRPSCKLAASLDIDIESVIVLRIGLDEYELFRRRVAI